MAQKYSNNAGTTLASGITNVATSISVVSSSTFPTITASDYFLATLYDLSGASEINHEIIKVTAVSGTTLTVVRGQEGTTARAFTSGTRIEVRFTAGSISHYADIDSTNTFSAPQVISVNTASDALRITQTGAGNALVVEDSANPDATPFVIDSTGNLTIGYATGTYKLNVKTDLYSEAALDGVLGGYLHFRRVATSQASPTVIASGNVIGQLVFEGYDGSAYKTSATIEAIVDNTPGTNDMPGRLVFSTTADGSSTPTERMRIDSAGSVGIGGTPASARILTLSRNITGGTNSTGARVDGVIQSDVTSNARGFHNIISTSATSFGLANAYGFFAEQGTIGATSSITNQFGFATDGTLIGATNNYGFYSNIASGTGRWNFYANGTAANYFAGDIQLGKTVTAAGTTGAQTINKTVGSVNFAAAATSLVVTNNLVTTSSIITATVGSNDSTMKSVAVVAAAGSFTLYANAAPTAETRVNFHVFN